MEKEKHYAYKYIILNFTPINFINNRVDMKRWIVTNKNFIVTCTVLKRVWGVIIIIFKIIFYFKTY